MPTVCRGCVARSALVSRPFHIEDRARGRIVAAGEIDADGWVVWPETEDSVYGELADLAAEIEQHLTEASSGSARGDSTPMTGGIPPVRLRFRP